MTQVTDHVFCVQRRDYLSCSYFVLRPSGVVLIDAGIDPTATDVREALQAVGRSASDVTAILLTHWHNDHSSGAASVVRESGAKVYYHEEGDAKFTRAARARGFRGWFAARLPAVGFWAPLRGLLELAPPHAVAATSFLRDGDRVESDFVAFATPGHEIGHMSFYFEPDRVLFAGDALAVVNDRVSFMSRFLTHDRAAAKRSMLRCLELDCAAICPGHRYPLLNPNPAMIEQARATIRRLRWWPIIGC